MKTKTKIIVLLTVAILITVAIGFISDTLMPLFGNDVALGQLENDDAYFVAMQSWHRLNNYLSVAAGIIWLVVIVNIANVAYKIYKNKNKNGENE